MPNHEMSKADSERIQSSQAKSGGDMSQKGFGARAQSASDRNASSAQTQGAGSTNAKTGGNQGAGKK
ncbi:hypothetical protein JX265_010584 [Neoarthrinium moseri]|uniref:SMP domain-containing protein n=1 Tax=Neoarthrinium moseri TaxID=1658444 RepID=A0A9Q0AKJ2_9PEZI|nr:uncharacterized protein JN550_011119 [Neoarthrinium moseri]KAI1846207.1 hypothetical protein JX266_007732 [Neoarthrinium moseri]KAI1859107.1 hypothetical protein JX265_010584 [Neoarthrinium moseri]KAI1860964.1 hypothetical protein JN550_011119 [Neoarthrinium moseri]